MSMKYHGVTVNIGVIVYDTETELNLLIDHEYQCFVQPPPHSYERQQVLEIEIFAMAQIKYVNELYCRIELDSKLKDIFAGKSWAIEASLHSFTMKEL